MQTEKHLSRASVLLYFIFLLGVGLFSFIKKVNIIDLTYLIVVLCCVLKYFIIIKSSKD